MRPNARGKALFTENQYLAVAQYTDLTNKGVGSNDEQILLLLSIGMESERKKEISDQQMYHVMFVV